MRVAIGADHAGYRLKDVLVGRLADQGFAIIDLGTHSDDPVDYPDFAYAVGRAVLDGRADRGIVICGSGAGAAVAANKLRGIRCALAHDVYTAHQSVEHDDVNLLALGSRVVGEELAAEIVGTFLRARFSGEERHRRRLGKVIAIEEGKDGLAGPGAAAAGIPAAPAGEELELEVEADVVEEIIDEVAGPADPAD
jgi:RpiB/LacA/LacB family sugar-phosphate isomerase